MKRKENKFSIVSRLKSIVHAVTGLGDMLFTERNAWIHAFATVLALDFAWWLGIDQNGQFFLDIVPRAGAQYTGMRKISDADLEQQLIAIYAARTVDKIMFLKADQNIKYERVQQAIAIARRAGVRVIGAIADRAKLTEPPPRN